MQASFYLFSIVDYDTSGWIIKNAFVKDLNFYGIKNTHMTDLLTPDMLTPGEIKLARYKIPVKEIMRVKNKKWLAEISKRHYKNQKYLIRGKTVYGLEAEAVSAKRLSPSRSTIPLNSGLRRHF